MLSYKVLVAAAAVLALTTSGCGAVNNLVQSKVNEAKSTAVSAQGTVVSAVNATVAPEVTKAIAAATKKANVKSTNTPEAPSDEATPESNSGGDNAISIGNLDQNLNKLKSYREHVVYAFSSKDEKGNPTNSSLDLLQEVIVATKDQHIKMTNLDAASTSDATKKAQAYETFQVGGSMYIYNNTGGSDSSCTSFSTSTSQASDPTAMFKPNDFLGNLQNAKLIAKGEMVNGIMTDHYQASDKDFGMAVFTSAKGEIWVAQDGNWVVKYVGEASGKSAMFGNASEGSIKWEYNIEEANKLAKIVLPAECAASKPADDIPVPENTTEKGNLGSMITFKSPDDVSAITTFYRTKLTAQGWKEAEGGLEGMMSFTKESRSLTILISKEDGGGSNVVITDTTTK